MRLVSSRMTISPSVGCEDSLNGLMNMKMMWITCHGRCSQQISTQLKTYRRFWTDGFDSALHHHHWNSKYVLKEWCPSFQEGSREYRINAKTHWSSIWWPNTSLRHFQSGFPLICHLSVCDRMHFFFFLNQIAKFNFFFGSPRRSWLALGRLQWQCWLWRGHLQAVCRCLGDWAGCAGGYESP